MGCLTATTARLAGLSVRTQRASAIKAMCVRQGGADIKLHRLAEISAQSARKQALSASVAYLCSVGSYIALTTEDGATILTENKELLTI